MKILQRLTAGICSVCVGLCAVSVSAAAETALEETVLYSGSTAVGAEWTLGTSTYTTNANGDFDPYLITEGGYFEVEYTGTENGVYLAFSEWATEKWASVTATETGTTAEGYYSRFRYDACEAAYGTADFTDVDAICTGSTTGPVTITKVSWYGTPLEDDLHADALLYKGSASATAKDTNLTFFYTKHVGGDFDAAQINEGSYFYVEYTGAEDGIYLAFSSASGATQWAAVYPDETGTAENGKQYSVYTYESVAAAFGTNFARLDEILAYSATNSEVTLNRIAYFAGEGEPVDTTDGTWDRPTEGIAFIGDSIVQNALLRYGDWNEILDRTDCVNYGIGGQTTEELVPRIGDITRGNYNTVVFLCGINDIGHGLTAEEIVANYETMFDAIHTALPDTSIVVISVLPTTPVFYTNAQDLIVNLDTALKAMTERYDYAQYVDAYSQFVQEDGYCDPDLVFDGLHPNETGYGVIASVLKEYLPEESEEPSEEPSGASSNNSSGSDSEPANNSSDEDPGVNSGNAAQDTDANTDNNAGHSEADSDSAKTGSAAAGLLLLCTISAAVVTASGKKHR